MVKPVVRKQILIFSILALFASAPVLADPSSDGSVTSILQSIGTGLGGANSALNQIGNSQQSVQSLVNYMAAIRAQQSMFTNNQSTINQINQKMAVALGNAQLCLAKATKDVSKYKNATIDPITLKTTEVTCNNYANVLDSVKAYLDKIIEANTKIGCLDTLSKAEKTIADSAKSPFSQLIDAANQSWNTQGDIITQYKNMGDDLDKRMSDYTPKLQALNALKLQVMDAIDGAKGTTQVAFDGATVSLDTGLAAELTAVTSARNNVANQWQQGILKDAWSCFNSDSSQPCDSQGGTASPAACITQQVGNLAGNSVTQGVQNSVNAQRLQSVFTTQSGILLRGDKATSLDAKNPTAFLNYSKSSFDALNSKMTDVLKNYKGFVGNNVQAKTLADFFHAKMSSCYSNAVANFNASMASDGSTTLGTTADAMNYKGMQNEIINGNPNMPGEKQIVASSKKWLTVVSGQMTAFTTSFNTTYNSTLPTFAANCAASDDAAQNLDCLRKLSATLQSGIDGTNHSVTLSNGSTFQTNLGLTTLSVNTMTLSATGAPATGTSSVVCKGFTDCLNMLKNARDYDVKQSASYSTARDKFVVAANSNVKANLGLLGQAFVSSGQVIGNSLNAVNAQLKGLGFAAQLKPKLVVGAELDVDKTTGLVSMPVDMEAAIAGKGSVTEVDDHTDFADEMKEKFKEYAKKANEAIKMKTSCSVVKADYTSILNSLGKDCKDTTNVCQEHKLQAALKNTEGVLNKSLIKGSSTDSENNGDGGGSSNQNSVDTINSDFKDCITLTRTGTTANQSELTTCGMIYSTDPDLKKQCVLDAQRKAAALAGSSDQCISDFAEALSSLNQRARNSDLSNANGQVIDDIVDLETACLAKDATTTQSNMAAATTRSLTSAQKKAALAQTKATDADAKAKAAPSDKSLQDAATAADKALTDANEALQSLDVDTTKVDPAADPAANDKVIEKCNTLKDALNADVKNAPDKMDDGSGTDTANSIDGGAFSNPQKGAQ